MALPQALVLTIALKPQSYMKDLARRLKKFDISQGELAREMGVQHSQVNRWFRGKHRDSVPMIPSLANIEKIEKAILAIRRGR